MKKQIVILVCCLLALAFWLGDRPVYAGMIRQIPGMYYSKIRSGFIMEGNQRYRDVIYKAAVPANTGKTVKILTPLEDAKISVWNGQGKCVSEKSGCRDAYGQTQAVFWMPAGISYIRIRVPAARAGNDRIRIEPVSWAEGLTAKIEDLIFRVFEKRGCLKSRI